MVRKYWYLLLFLLVSLVVIHRTVFTLYFSQDDFYHLTVSFFANKLKDFLAFFTFPHWQERGYAFYRPIFREVYYFVFTKLFGLNILPWRIFQLLLHFGCTVLVFGLIQRLFKKAWLSFVVAFFYTNSAVQVGTFYYQAGGVQGSGATLFFLATLHFYLSYLAKKKTRFWFLSVLTFVLAMISHEIVALILPAALTGLDLVLAKKRDSFWLMGVAKRLGPLLVSMLIFVYLDLTKIGFPQDTTYTPNFSVNRVLNTYFWYVLYAVGVPDMLVDFVGPGLKINPKLMLYWGDYYRVIFPSLFLFWLLFGLSAGYLWRKKDNLFKQKKFYFFLLWFPLALVPVAILPWHKFLYYLNPAMPAFWLIIWAVILSVYQQLLKKSCLLAWGYILLTLGSLLVLNWVSIKFAEGHFWAINRGRIAKNLIAQIKTTYPVLPPGAIVYFKNDPRYPFIADQWGGSSTQASYVLSVAGRNALQLYYADPTIRVYYEDLGGPPKEKTNVFSLTAIIKQ